MSPSLINCLRIAGVMIVISLVLLSMAEPLFAGDNESWLRNRQHWLRRWKRWKQHNCGLTQTPERVPEISLGEAGAAGALIVGTVLILTDRMRRRRLVLKAE